jgi:hypothetical protein
MLPRGEKHHPTNKLNETKEQHSTGGVCEREKMGKPLKIERKQEPGV